MIKRMLMMLVRSAWSWEACSASRPSSAEDQGSHGQHGRPAADRLGREGRKQRLAAADRRRRQPACRARRRSVARSGGRGRGDRFPVGRRGAGGPAPAAAAQRRRGRQAAVAGGDGEAGYTITYERDIKQLKAQAISQAIVDNDERQSAAMPRRRSPSNRRWSTRRPCARPSPAGLGLRQVDLGQYLPAGTVVVTLQALDSDLRRFLPAAAGAGARSRSARRSGPRSMPFPAATFTGKITAINPKVETASRNVQVRATLPQRRPQAAARHVRDRRDRRPARRSAW